MLNAVSRAYVRGGVQAISTGLKATGVAINSMGKVPNSARRPSRQKNTLIT